MEELIDLPDGKYIMDAEMWRSTEQGSRKRLFGSQVRVTINEGNVQEWKVCLSDRWYTENPEGIRLSKGFTFIETTEQLQALSSDLPYSWRM